MNDELEIIEFKRPEGSRKNLFISGIPFSPEDTVIDSLYKIFEPYGLLHGVQLYPYNKRNLQVSAETLAADSNIATGYYAFVTFYSAREAQKAKDSLNSRVYLGGIECKIAYAKRKKEDTNKQLPALHFSKCQELANRYLGYNSWCLTIKVLEEENDPTRATSGSDGKVKYVCLCRLDMLEQALHTEGLGAWVETFLYTDPTSRGKAICKSKKLAYQRAVEEAFSKFLLIVLPNGKVYVEVDTTRLEPIRQEREINQQELLPINNLDREPTTDDSDATNVLEAEEDIDAVNLHILHELEDNL